MECTTPIVVYPTYNSHYDCATAGFINSLGVIREIGEEYVNLNRVYVNFSCEPEETI